MKKNIAVVGYGGQGGWHANHALKSDVIALGGIFDIKEERQQAARDAGIKAYNSLDEILADNSIDIVVCATPNDVHKDIVIRSLEAGKNVVCEKPVALSIEDFDDMCEAAKKAGKLFTVHQNRRWDVDFLAIKSVIESGEIGETINIESRVHGSRGIPSDWRCLKPYGGGMVLDWGVHLIDQALMVLGFDGIESVRCTFEHITNDEVDDGFKLWINYANGKEAFIEVGTYNFIAMPRFYMRAKNGSAFISDWRENCKVAKCKAWHESDVVPVQTAAGLTKTMAPRDSITLDEYELERPKSDVHDYYRNFIRTAHGEDTQFVTHDQMRVVLKVIMKAFESVECGEKVAF